MKVSITESTGRKIKRIIADCDASKGDFSPFSILLTVSIEAHSSGGWYSIMLCVGRIPRLTIADHWTDIGMNAEAEADRIAKQYGVMTEREVEPNLEEELS